MTKEEIRVLWLERVEAFKTSGQTQTAFCADHGLHLKQFSYWLRKYKTIEQPMQVNPSGWMALEAKEHVDYPQGNSIDIRIGQAIVEVKLGFDQKLLLDVMKTLRALC